MNCAGCMDCNCTTEPRYGLGGTGRYAAAELASVLTRRPIVKRGCVPEQDDGEYSSC